MPPKSTWTPGKTEYVPPRNDYIPPKSNFEMPKSTYCVPQGTDARTVTEPVCPQYEGPMARILEMGYFNKPRIAQLLNQYEGDVQKVVEILISETDNNWAESRHGNTSEGMIEFD